MENNYCMYVCMYFRKQINKLYINTNDNDIAKISIIKLFVENKVAYKFLAK